MDDVSSAESERGVLDFPFHVVLLSVYPILHLYSRNLVYISFRETLRTMGLSIGLFLLFLLAFWAVLRDWDKAGALSSLLSCLFYSFGHVLNALEPRLKRGDFGVDAFVVRWIWLLVFLLASYLIVRLELPKAITGFLNVTSVILVALVLSTIIRASDVDSEISAAEEAELAQMRGERKAEASMARVSEAEYPHIYYIVLDAYVRADYLEELYGYDNSWFVNALEERGFYVASSSRSNYLNTNYSLNTSLNLLYFHELPNSVFHKAKYNLFTNYVSDFLRELGYRTVVFDSGYGDTNSQDPDAFVGPTTTGVGRKSPINSFEQLLLRTNVEPILLGDRSEVAGSGRPTSPASAEANRRLALNRRRISYAFSHLPDYASRDTPHFLFAHIYSPHIPFLYGPDGEELEYHEIPTLYWYEVPSEDYTEYYSYQVDYLNHAVLNTLDAILQNSERPVVIVLQADHGDGKFLDRDAPTTKGVEVRSAILNAVYFSDHSYDGLYRTMTPVNTFRVVLNHWFGTRYPLLRDKVFFHEHSAETGINEKPAFVDACAHFDVCLADPPD